MSEEIEETTDMIDDSFDDSPKDDVIEEETIVDEQEEISGEDQFEEGESLVGEKYIAPVKDEKFVDVRKGVVIDKKDVSPILQIKSFFENNNIKIRDPKSGCKKCYGRGYTGFELKTQTYVPCKCLFPAQSQVERDKEANRIFMERKLGNSPAAIREMKKWEKKTRAKILHQKVLELFKNKDVVMSAGAELSKQTEKEVVNG